MSKTLGLDLGTNSIGWALIQNNENKSKLLDKGVLIFSEGVKKEKGQEKSKAAERTLFRSARRLKFRRKIRKYQTLLLLSKYDMCPLNILEVKEWRNSNFKKYPNNPEFLNWLKTDENLNINPYYFRDKASREKISKYGLGRALYHFAQRRGFLSNRLDQSDKGVIEKAQPEIESIIDEFSTLVGVQRNLKEYFQSIEILDKRQKDLNIGEQKLKILYNSFNRILQEKTTLLEIKNNLKNRLFRKENLGDVKKGITELDLAIKNSNCETLGQYFWKIYQEDRNDTSNKIRNNYTSREDHYLHEFEIICNVQNLKGIDSTKQEASLRYNGIVQELYKAIFYQRPLKSQKGLIGKCSLEPNRTRASISRPEFEEFRAYSFINTIKLKSIKNEDFRFLTQKEKEKIKPKFYRKSKTTFDFEDIKNLLGKDLLFNYKDRTTVSGCPTTANLINVFGSDWKTIIFKNYVLKTITNRKTNQVLRQKTENEVVADIWHVLSTYTSDEKLKNFALNNLKVDLKTAEKFSKIHLKKEYASLSLFAINKILPYLKSGLLYSHAVFMANMNNLVKLERWENKEDRLLIEKEVGEIINKHQEENRLLFVVNSVLQNCFNNNFKYSKQAENGYKVDLEKALQKEFGINNWTNISNEEEVLKNSFGHFIEYLKIEKYAIIKRVDIKILDFLSDNDLLKIASSNKIYHPSDIEKFKTTTIKDKKGNEFIGLGTPDVSSIKNPMAMKSLHQLKKLINTLITERQIDENTKINIELARQLNDANKRKAIENWQNDRKELYLIYAEKIKELYSKENNGEVLENLNNNLERASYAIEQKEDGKIINKEDVLKYAFWKEQNHICIYTGKTINLSSFLGANSNYDIEHTLPRSLSWDNSQMNKTLCYNKFNRDVKGNKIPFDLQMNHEILPRINHWKNKFEALDNEIQKLIKLSRNATDKNQKDKFIQKRHYLKMEYNYWKGKYSRFTMEEIKDGFKNSQSVDIGIISKYSRAYLKSVFRKVYSVKGEMVSEYRKAWGVNITKADEEGRLVKNRDNHIHHCIDAVTIANMNKNKYDKLAHAWNQEEKGNYKEARKELENEKPWKTFTEDVRNLENEVLIVHHTKDKLPSQTKRKFRKRGKIQKNNEGNTIFLKGDTVRGSLHLDTYYGAIAKDKDNNVAKDNKGNIVPNYVLRKELQKLKKTDVANIIDKGIRTTVEEAVKDHLIVFSKNGAKIKDDAIWQNKNKQIPIKKIRIYAPTVKSPLRDFKKHSEPFLSKKGYKQQFNVVNEENYCMAIYEGLNEKGKLKRNFEIINNLDAGNYFKKSNSEHRQDHKITPLLKLDLPLKYILKKGVMVLMYEKSPDEIWELVATDRVKRLYKLAKFDAQGRLSFRPHSEGKAASELKEVYSIDFDNLREQVRLQVSKLNLIVENIHFSISISGKIEKI